MFWCCINSCHRTARGFELLAASAGSQTAQAQQTWLNQTPCGLSARKRRHQHPFSRPPALRRGSSAAPEQRITPKRQCWTGFCSRTSLQQPMQTDLSEYSAAVLRCSSSRCCCSAAVLQQSSSTRSSSTHTRTHAREHACTHSLYLHALWQHHSLLLQLQVAICSHNKFWNCRLTEQARAAIASDRQAARRENTKRAYNVQSKKIEVRGRHHKYTQFATMMQPVDDSMLFPMTSFDGCRSILCC